MLLQIKQNLQRLERKQMTYQINLHKCQKKILIFYQVECMLQAIMVIRKF